MMTIVILNFYDDVPLHILSYVSQYSCPVHS